MSDEKLLAVMTDIRNWIRAASHGSVKTLLESALPDAKARGAYQMTDGKTTIADIRGSCKMSPNDVVALQSRCVSMGLMEVTAENRRRRLFDLQDFGLLASTKDNQKEGATNEQKNGRSKRSSKH
jgi:hypothetical protein